MSATSWGEQRSQGMTLWDIGFLKLSSLLFGVVLGAYLASFVLANLWLFLVPMFVLGGWSGYRWLTNDG